MSSIELRHSILRGDFRLEVNTVIPSSGVTGVFGESGSGKTTLLRCIAGLEGFEKGSLPVHRRRIGYVFQEPQLFAHLSVRKNIEYGMRRNANSDVSVDEIATLFDIDALMNRAVSGLSGGEAQRVSIARVLCQSPQLILMDEPLSALDERRRNEVLPYLDRLHAKSSVPIIYVSHNIDEICRLSDHLLVVDKGKIVAEGELADTLARIDLPQLGGHNAGAVIEAAQLRYDEEYDLTLFGFAGGEIWVAGHHESTDVRLRISASDVSLCRVAAEETTILNTLPAVIEETAEESSSTVLVRLRLGDQALVARITRRSLKALDLCVGDEVFAQIKSVTVRR
jgi:molybdate transport system ATP-binding protein